MSDVTNKTEMVSVPRELLERLLIVAAPDSTTKRPAWYVDALYALLAAPAEDVRAVWEEPDAYQVVTDRDRRFTRCKISSADCAKHLSENGHSDVRVEPLYRHPQRPVVLPERSNERDHAGDFTYEAKARNACIDEFERLNK